MHALGLMHPAQQVQPWTDLLLKDSVAESTHPPQQAAPSQPTLLAAVDMASRSNQILDAHVPKRDTSMSSPALSPTAHNKLVVKDQLTCIKPPLSSTVPYNTGASPASDNT